MLPRLLFFYPWAKVAEKNILGAKFGGPAQNWGKASLGEGKIGANPGPLLGKKATFGCSLGGSRGCRWRGANCACRPWASTNRPLCGAPLKAAAPCP
jgi:hypothetical protein